MLVKLKAAVGVILGYKVEEMICFLCGELD